MNAGTRLRPALAKVVPATALFLVVSLNSPPTIPSVPASRPAPPSAEELAVLEEVRAWILGDGSLGGFRALRQEDLAAAIRSRPQTFELFRSSNDPDLRSERLRGLPFGELIEKAARRHRVDGLLLAAVAEAESGFDPSAVSPQGALGLMQLMPGTAGKKDLSEVQDPSLNVEIGARYLRHLLRRFEGDVVLALAAYNAGPGAVERFHGVPPYPETREYVGRVLSLYLEHHQSIWKGDGAEAWLE